MENKLVYKLVIFALILVSIISCKQIGNDEITIPEYLDLENLPATSSGMELNEGVIILTKEELSNNLVERTLNIDNTITLTFLNQIEVERSIGDQRSVVLRSSDSINQGDSIYVEPYGDGGNGFWGEVIDVIYTETETIVTVIQDGVESVMEFIGPIVFSEPIDDISFSIDSNSMGSLKFDENIDLSIIDDIALTLKFTNIIVYFYYDYSVDRLEYIVKYDYESNLYLKLSSSLSKEFKHKFPVAPVIVGPFTISLAPYIALDLEAGVSGEIDITSLDKISYHYSYIGGELVEQNGFDPFEPLGNIVTTPTFSGEATATAKVGLELDLLFVDCVGPYYDINAYLKGALKYTSSTRYSEFSPELLWGVKGSLGVKLELFDSLQRMSGVNIPGIPISKSFDYYKYYIYPLNGKPDNITKSSNGSSNTISWESDREDLTKFVIQRTLENGTYDTGEEFIVVANQHTLVDTNVVPDTNYFYRIKGMRNDQSTLWSDEIIVATGSSSDFIPPNEVTNLSVASGNSQISLSWTNPTDSDFDHVEIWYGIGTANTKFYGTINNSGTMISGLTNSVEYVFTIRTVDEVGNTSTGTSENVIPIVEPDPNTDPRSVITGSASGITGTSISYNGSDSYDNDSGDSIVSYSWVLTRPIGSSSTLTSATSVVTNFTPDIAGNYSIQLRVYDTLGSSDSDTLAITIVEAVDTGIITNVYFSGTPDPMQDEIVYVNVSNSGTITGNYTVNLTSLGDFTMPVTSKTISISAGSSGAVPFHIRFDNSQSVTLNFELLDGNDDIADTDAVTISATGSTSTFDEVYEREVILLPETGAANVNGYGITYNLFHSAGIRLDVTYGGTTYTTNTLEADENDFLFSQDFNVVVEYIDGTNRAASLDIWTKDSGNYRIDIDKIEVYPGENPSYFILDVMPGKYPYNIKPYGITWEGEYIEDNWESNWTRDNQGNDIYKLEFDVPSNVNDTEVYDFYLRWDFSSTDKYVQRVQVSVEDY